MSTVTNANVNTNAIASVDRLKGRSNTARSLARLRRHTMALIGAGLLVFVVGFVVIGSIIITPAESIYNDPSRKLQSVSEAHWFGTDAIGRDLLARTVYGGQISLFVGITAVVVQIVVGTVIGLAAGYLGGIVDSLLMRFAEAMLCIPQLFLALIALRIFSDPTKFPDFQIFGREYSATVIVIVFVIGLTSWMRVARIVRSVVLSVKEQEYVTAARSLGASGFRIVFSHVLPNCLPPIIVAATLGVAAAILLEAYLGFLGLGVRPPTPTWGNIMGEANNYIKYWHYWFFPAVAIMLTTLGINFLGDGLRDAFDPRSLR
jgi:peptide/nickel transport system permease protein